MVRLARFFEMVLPQLYERQCRVLAGAAAQLFGNETVVAEAAADRHRFTVFDAATAALEKEP
jgi:hypothetical protein